jgi:hypothetical protein
MPLDETRQEAAGDADRVGRQAPRDERAHVMPEPKELAPLFGTGRSARG